MQEKRQGATRVEQIVHHAEQFVDVLDRKRNAVSRAEKDALTPKLREKEADLAKAVKTKEAEH